MKKEHMMDVQESLRKIVLAMTERMPEDADRANGVLMLISNDLSDQMMKLSRAGANTEVDRDTAVNIASTVLRCKREVESICAAAGIELPFTEETYPEP